MLAPGYYTMIVASICNFQPALSCSNALLSFIQDTPEHNLKTAFEVAERDLDIPQMLDVEGMMSCKIALHILGLSLRSAE